MANLHWLTDVGGDFDSGPDWTGGKIPGAKDAAILDAAGSKSYTVTVSTLETVSNVQTAATATLRITAPATTAPFTATHGTGAGANMGRIDIGAGQGETGSSFAFAGRLDNAGEVLLFGAGEGTSNALMVNGPSSTLSGGGRIALDGLNTGPDPADTAVIEGGAADAALTNVDNTIFGGGSIHLSSLALTNAAKGKVDATDKLGLFMDGVTPAASVVANAGMLEATGAGLLVLNDLTVANTANQGLVEANGAGAMVQLNGVTMAGGSLRTLQGGAVVLGSAITFDGTASAVTNLGLLDLSTFTLTTNGAVTNRGEILGEGTGHVVIGDGTILNFGTIASDDGQTALTLGSATDVLVEEGTGVLTGKVSGGGGELQLLETVVTGAGTISGLGQTLTDFKSIVVEAGGGWRFVGPNTISKGVTLTTHIGINESGTLTNDGVISQTRDVFLESGSELLNNKGAEIDFVGDVGVTTLAGVGEGSLVNKGLIQKKSGVQTSNIWANVDNGGQIEVVTGSINFLAVVGGSGKMTIDAGATLRFDADVAAGGTITFGGTKSVLQLDDPTAFAARASGFSAGDTIDVRGLGFWKSTTVSYSGTKVSGVLTLTNGVDVAKIALLGQYMAGNFHEASDGHGGAAITFVATPAPLAMPAGHHGR